DGTPSSIRIWRITSARFSDRRRESEDLSPLGPPKASSCTRDAPAPSKVERSPATLRSLLIVAVPGSVSPRANNISLRLVRLLFAPGVAVAAMTLLVEDAAGAAIVSGATDAI